MRWANTATAACPCARSIPSPILRPNRPSRMTSPTWCCATIPAGSSRQAGRDLRRQDEARVGQQGTLTRVWARRGTRPRALRRPTAQLGLPVRRRLSRTRHGCCHHHARRPTPSAMNEHLAEISRCVDRRSLRGPGGRRCADRTRRSRLVVPHNLGLLQLQPTRLNSIRRRLSGHTCAATSSATLFMPVTPRSSPLAAKRGTGLSPTPGRIRSDRYPSLGRRSKSRAAWYNIRLPGWLNTLPGAAQPFFGSRSDAFRIAAPGLARGS